MSKEALAALESIAGDAKPSASASQQAMLALSEVASGNDPDDLLSDASMKRLASGERTPVRKEPSTFDKTVKFFKDYANRVAVAGDAYKGSMGISPLSNPMTGAGEALLSLGTGAAAPFLGSAEALVTGADPDEASQRYIYEPRTEVGKSTLGMIGAAASPLTSIAEETGADAALLPLAMEAQTVHSLPKAKNLPTEADLPVILGKSGGAAAAATDVTKLSPQLRRNILAAAQRGDINPQSVERHIEADSLPVRMELSRGQALQDPVLISKEQNMRAKNPEFAARFNQQNQQLIDNLDEIRRETAPTVVGNDHIQNGQTLIDAYKTIDEQAKADIGAKYKALEEANGGKFPVNGQLFVKSADAALSKKLKGRYVPAEIKADLDDLRSGTEMTFEQFENMRTNLAAEARKAERNGDGNALAAVNIVREQLESLPIEGEAAALKPLADAARTAARERFERIKADPAYKAASEDAVGIGEASPLADDFVTKYVVRGKGANIKKMREHLAGNESAQEAIAAGALDYLKSKSGINLYTNEGNFSQAGYNRALSELNPRLKDIVSEETAETLQRLGNVARYTQFQPRGAFVNNSNTFTAALGQHALNAMEGAANVKAGGIPVGTFVRKKMEGKAEQKFAEESLKPGAGVSMKDLLSKEKKK